MFIRMSGLVFFSFFCCTLVYAGAWVQPAGQGLNIFSVRRYLSDRYWTSGGRLQSTPTYAKNSVEEYLEYGVTDKLTLGLYVSGLQSHTSAMGTRGGVNDQLLLGRYLFWTSGSMVASFQLMVDKLGPGANVNIPPQNSGFNSGESILLGTSGSVKTGQFWFADASLGLVQRYSAGNQVQLILEGGYKMKNDSLWFMLQNYNTFSSDHINYPQGIQYNLITIAPSMVYWVTHSVALQAGVTQDLYGQNVGKGASAFLAMWLRFGG